jgi:hypothetical protein
MVMLHCDAGELEGEKSEGGCEVWNMQCFSAPSSLLLLI